MCVFIIFLMLNRKGDWRLNLILIFILLFSAADISSIFFMSQGFGMKYIPLAHICGATSFCVGPLLYLYLRHYFTNRFFFLKSDIFHFILFLCALVLFTIFAVTQEGNYSVRPVTIISPACFYLYNLLYLAFSLMLFIKQRFIPIAKRRHLSWPVFIFCGYIANFVVSFGVYFIWEICCPSSTYTYTKSVLFHTFADYSIILYFTVFVFFTNTLILFALRRVHVFQSRTKYKYSRLSTERKGKFKKKICELMEHDKPYLDPLLSLDGMALSLGVSSKDLSQILNECFACNFADFINSFRVQEAIHLLEHDTENRTILNISLDAGFNAKSTFNLVFKKHTGVSPREYVKSVLK